MFENCLHSLFSSRARKAAVALVFLALAALGFSPRADAALKAWRLWSEAITDYVPTSRNQYGPFRIGPAYPYTLP